MKKQEFLTEYRFFLDKVYKKVCEKNADYSGAAGDDNPLHNIRMVETLRITDTETGILLPTR